MYFYYCPVCGFIYKNPIKECEECGTKIPIKKSLYAKDYYQNKATEKYHDDCTEIDVFFILHNEEIEDNPHFNEEIYTDVHNKKFRKNFKPTTINDTSTPSPTTNQQQQQYTPKCPVCQSPNINKISGLSRAAHGLTFGLFSKTARSQWVCNSCGNKW